MSATVIRLPTAATPAEREHAKRVEYENALLDLYDARLAADRAEDKRVAKMVVPFRRPRRRSAKPSRPTGPRPAA